MGARQILFRKLLAPILFVFGLSFAANAIEPVVGETYVLTAGDYEGHLVWVGKIETDAHGATIVHVAIAGPFKLETDIGMQTVPMIGHVPIERGAFVSSALAVSEIAWHAERELGEGYSTWLEANGGVFTLTVSEVIDTIFWTVLDN